MQSDDVEAGARPPTADTQGVPDTAEGDHEEAGEHIHLSPKSIWPVTTAFGTAVAGFGLVSIPFVSIIGLFIMAWGIIGWVQELRHEPH